MKKLLILILAMSLAFMFVGCSDDDDDATAVTKVSFKNHTNADVTVVIDGVDDVDGTLVAGETWSYTFDNAIFVDEDVLTLNYTIEGIYVVTATNTITIEKNKTTTVDVISEGGVVVLKNNHYLDINLAVIYQADGPATGSNILAVPLVPGDSILVLKDADDYRVSLTLENGALEAIDTFTLADNQMSYATISAEKNLSVANQTSGYITFRINGGSINRLEADELENFNLSDIALLDIDATFNGLYIFSATNTYDFYAETTYEENVTADGGALFVVNGTEDNITEVYLSPSSSSDWGTNWMANSSITPGNDYAWTLEAGLWDVKIVDDAGYEAVIENNQVDLNQSKYVDYSDKAKTRGTNTNLKNKANYNYPVGGTRVEGN